MTSEFLWLLIREGKAGALETLSEQAYGADGRANI